MTTLAVADPLRQAVAFLAGCCDGAVTRDEVGFNGVDAAFGHSLAAAPFWTTRQRQAAFRLVQKYRQQVMAGTGIDVAAIEEDLAPTTAKDILGPGGAIAAVLPGYEHRDAQLRMAATVEQAIEGQRHAAIEAGTGSGKSFGYLVPAILSRQKTIVSTADKSLQGQIIGKDLPFLSRVMPRRFIYALLKGRSNYLCLNRMNEHAKSLVEPEFLKDDETREQWNRLVEWYNAKPEDGDLDTLDFTLKPEIRSEVVVTSEECIGKKCPFFGSCYVERAKGLAREADIVVVNHALLLRDAAIRGESDGHAHVLPDAAMCIADEAHVLEEVAADALGIEISLARWRRLYKRLSKLTIGHPLMVEELSWRGEAADLYGNRAGPVADLLERAIGEIQARFRGGHATTLRLGHEGMLAAAGQIVSSLARTLAEETPEWLDAGERAEWEKVVENLHRLARALKIVASPDEDSGFVRYAQLEGRGRYERVVLYAKPIDVSDLLREMLFTRSVQRVEYDDGRVFEYFTGYDTVIATSATLADGGGFAHWRGRVGLDHALELQVASPFDYRNHALLYLPKAGSALDPSTSREDGNRYYDALADEMLALLQASNGRAFLLFTSYRALDEVYRHISGRQQRWTLLRQGDMPRPLLVEKFRDDTHSVLFGTRSFWHGVDVQGESLSLVAIDKLPFTTPDDPLWEARCAAINKRRGSSWAWFRELAVPNATILLKQATGRLIRSKQDVGVMAILDARLVAKPYGKEILRALPPAPVTQSLDVVREFYG